MSATKEKDGMATVEQLPNIGGTTMASGTVRSALPSDRLEAEMSLAHAEFVAAARIRKDMDGHLNLKMEAKLNKNVAMAGARYVDALDAFEASA